MSKFKSKETTAVEEESTDKHWSKVLFNNLKITKPRPPDPQNAVTIAISSRILFNMVEERKIFREQGIEALKAYEVEHEKEPLKPGPAFPFIKALMNVNTCLRELYPDSEELFDIVLMTSNHALIVVRLINSIDHYDLTIGRFCMTGGMNPIGYLKAYMTDLYVCKDPTKVREAIEEGFAAATLFMPDTDMSDLSNSQLRVAFDGDAVLFSDQSEIIVKQQGLDTFGNLPLAQNSLKCFLEALGKLQQKFYMKNEHLTCPIRTFLVTSHSAASSGACVLKTINSWGLEIDEAMFLDGASKGPLLQKICPHIYFDDQMFHFDESRKMVTFVAGVPYSFREK